MKRPNAATIKSIRNGNVVTMQRATKDLFATQFTTLGKVMDVYLVRGDLAGGPRFFAIRDGGINKINPLSDAELKVLLKNK